MVDLAPSAALPAPGAPIRTLVLDDDSFDRQRLLRMISALNMPVEADSAATLDELRSRMATRDYDLVFLDFGLQGGTGLDALTIVNDGAHGRDPVCVMVTNENRGDVAAACFRRGCRDFIPKSDLTPQMLSETVNALVPQPAALHLPVRTPEPAITLASPNDLATARRIGQILAPAMEQALAEAIHQLGHGPAAGHQVFPDLAYDDAMTFVFRDLNELDPQKTH